MNFENSNLIKENSKFDIEAKQGFSLNNSIKSLDKFHKSLKKKIIQCVVCHEAWPLSKVPSDCTDFTCRRCKMDKKHPKKFSLENKMISGVVPRSSSRT